MLPQERGLDPRPAEPRRRGHGARAAGAPAQPLDSEQMMFVQNVLA